MMLLQVITTLLLLTEGTNPHLTFEKNKGQAPADVHYLVHTEAYRLDLKRGELLFHFGSSALRVRFGGDLNRPVPEGHARLDGLVRYLDSPDDSGHKKDVPRFASVRYESLYSGIDLMCYGRNTVLECDFVIRPGGNPQQIRVGIEGAETISVDQTGSLVIQIDGHALHVHKPAAYQLIRGGRQTVEVSYEIGDANEVHFAIGEYNRSFPLVIDPY
jgi:hypothetical protein